MTQSDQRRGDRPGVAASRFASADLAAAVMAMDSPAARRILYRAQAAHGTVHTWDHVARPVLQLVAAQWIRSGTGVEDEHLLSQALAAVLTTALDAAPGPATRHPALLACMPGELHCLPLLALGAALAERGLPARNFGAALPVDALVTAVRCTAPAVVFLWAHTPWHADPDLLAALPRTRLLLGGPGWVRQHLPTTTTHTTSLAQATDHITATIRSAQRRLTGLRELRRRAQ